MVASSGLSALCSPRHEEIVRQVGHAHVLGRERACLHTRGRISERRRSPTLAKGCNDHTTAKAPTRNGRLDWWPRCGTGHAWRRVAVAGSGSKGESVGAREGAERE
eukprot:6204797-Pleurochrysis_carterae.AAC.3